MAESSDLDRVENVQNKLKLLMEVSGLDQGSAEEILTINDNNLERAINYHLEGHNDPTLPGPSNHFFQSHPNMPTLGGYDETNERLPLAGTSTATATLPDEDGVRAPIPPKREQMILPEEDNFRFRKRRNITHNVCPLRNFQEETEQQEARLAALVEGNHFHYANNVGWRNGGIEGASSSRGTEPTLSNIPKKRSRLADLFRPPTDLSVSGSLQTVREIAKNKNRWLIVNLQDYSQFQSQTLNRDLWSDEHLRAIIKQYFVFWQVAVDNTEGMRFQVFYSAQVLPYICILDPRTGEEKIGYSGFNKTSKEFERELLAFISKTPYPNAEEGDVPSVDINELMINDSTPASSKSKDVTKSRNNKVEASVLSEEDQLMLAIQNSLREISSDCGENSPTNELNGDSNESSNDGDDGVIEIGFESDSDVVEVKDNSTVSWSSYLGDEKDPKAKLILRLPDGNKEMLEWPCSTKLKALKLYVMDKYPDITKESFKIICPFPRQDILELNLELTLKSAQLYPTVTLHLHQDE
ncbi:UBX domain-containing protein 7 [Pseudolycoriella hygida]|uniref:UBX domain-containing protein 7 n=1 Tax=Pseudolycoriella hygida TaxID=35572 RepID=A0A9Q0N1S8_9DIPT|nr:UBX domain-containing protein 7 [Pseudolycoriella hygida]